MIDLVWEPLGPIELDRTGRPDFPATSRGPAIFRVRAQGKDPWFYVGHSETLADALDRPRSAQGAQADERSAF